MEDTIIGAREASEGAVDAPVTPVKSYTNLETASRQFDQLLESRDNWDMALSRIPSEFGFQDRASYLALRSLAISTPLALKMIGKSPSDLYAWWAEIPGFKQFELEKLESLQKDISKQILQIGFLRNMGMYNIQDRHIIEKGLSEGINSLSQREYNYFMAARKFYTPSDMLNLFKAINPEEHRETNEIILSFGTSTIGVRDEPKVINQEAS